MIVGIVMAVFVIVGVGVFVVFWTRRRQRKSQEYHNSTVFHLKMVSVQRSTKIFPLGCKSEKDYIVCFAPKPNNVNNFWNMVLSDEVDSIVMFAESKIP
ncbi:hypothetical protein MAR_018086, partial [Mya arenaria]